ncbi:MAG: MATE family efflux transporter [Prolixibacteraceae bacterium]|nr:MATE family efflux transporter [Prolixibacteraceae bacterium]
MGQKYFMPPLLVILAPHSESMERTRELAETGVGRLLVKYFVPSFVGVLVNTLYNIVDRIFIGQAVGAEALSGISVIFPIMLIMAGFGMLIGIGGSVLVSIRLGQKNLKEANKVLGTAFVMMLVASAIITIVGFLVKEPLLRSFGATAETYWHANDYLDIILWGAAFQLVGFSLNNLIRSEGNANVAMVSMLISAGTNIVLDAIFILVLDMGVKGAAYATVISMFVLSLWVVSHFFSRRSILKMYKENMKLNFGIALQIAAVGLSPFCMQAAGSFVQGVINTKLISYGGDLAVGAMGIIISVTNLIMMSIVAINMASQPIIGFNYGAKNKARVKTTLRYSLIAATCISVFFFALFEAITGALVNMFNKDSEQLYDMSVKGLSISLLAWPIVGFQIIAGNFFQAINKASISIFITLMRQVLILLPLIYFLSASYGLDGIWAAFPLSDVIAALMVSFFLIREWRKLDRLC